MSYLSKKGPKIRGAFTPVPTEMLHSKAFKSLTGNSAKLFPYLLNAGKLAEHRQEPDFSYTYSQATKAGFSKSTFSRVLKELHEKGFFVFTEYGGKRSFGLSAHKFRLSDRWRDFGTDKFEEVPWREPEKMKWLTKNKPSPNLGGYKSKNGPILPVSKH